MEKVKNKLEKREREKWRVGIMEKNQKIMGKIKLENSEKRKIVKIENKEKNKKSNKIKQEQRKIKEKSE